MSLHLTQIYLIKHTDIHMLLNISHPHTVLTVTALQLLIPSSLLNLLAISGFFLQKTMTVQPKEHIILLKSQLQYQHNRMHGY